MARMVQLCHLLSVAPLVVNGVQFKAVGRSEQDPADSGKMENFIQLDETEVRQRGSLCLDGQMPGFYLSPATDASASNKWVLGLQGGGWCKNPEECALRTKGDLQELKPTTDKLSIMGASEFSGYNHVLFWYCDAGLFSGDAEQPLVVTDPDDAAGLKKITLYFRGRRILDHIMDTLKEKHALSSATEVLLTGGSAGGLSTYLLADYMASQMPASVSKFRAAPQSGFWAFTSGTETGNPELDNKENKEFYKMQNLGAVLPAECKKALPPAEQWHCMFADFAYQYSTTPTFILQVLDNFVAVQNETSEDNAKANFQCIAAHMNETGCSQDGAQRLNGVMDGIVNNLKSTDKYTRRGEGGFISTCNLHSVYKWDEFYHYAINGVTMDKAVGAWWSSPDKAQAQWMLPCKFNDKPPYQCENSCAFEHS